MYHEWHYQDGVVRRLDVSDGRGCDGRLTQTYESVCPVDRLHAETIVTESYRSRIDGYEVTGYDYAGDGMINTHKAMRRPDWQEDKPTRVYDEYAQAAGY